MKIERLEITNFRQFYKTSTLEFSTDEKRNVTVVHGANGAGKTSLLNAFKWCFYESTDFDTENEHILNEAAIQSVEDGGILELKISVKFSHDRKKYDAIRTQKYRKLQGLDAEPFDGADFTLDEMGADGQTKRSKSPNSAIAAILPEDLQPYFFFNGERIEKLAGVHESDQVKNAIRTMMGLELVERAEDHMLKASRLYRRESKESGTQEETQLIEKIELLEDDIDSSTELKVTLNATIDKLKKRLVFIESELGKFAKSKQLQLERTRINESIDKNNLHINSLHINQLKLIESKGALVVAQAAIDKCAQIVEKNRKIGILPYRVKQQFIDDLIELEQCLCGRPITKHGIEHQALLDVRESAGTDEVEENFTRLSALLNTKSKNQAEYQEEDLDLTTKLKALVDENDNLSAQITEISLKLKGMDDLKITHLEEEHAEKQNEKDIAHEALGVASNNVECDNLKLNEMKTQLTKLQERLKGQSEVVEKRKFAEELSQAFKGLHDALTEQVREKLSERVNETFQKIIRKDIRAFIDTDYKLKIIKSLESGADHEARELSTGEKQVTSLSFISSIISMAKEQHLKDNKFFCGGLYPLVMDSPFGALDPDYRTKVAANVSVLAEQVIIFVSYSQWAGNVEEACRDKVGNSYKLIFHSPSSQTKIDNNPEYVKEAEGNYEYSSLERTI
ncbi:AAA family ATPase [Shewanella colwelliana]|uniref:AAA family ATPase n=1 Tax=Shewanella colwelliana TaxID=23 RepID=UPI00299EE872|nr:AAA family ATPase [Shewanella colwelliana]MDX1282977.1 AAA family ATPase [Shewanella colwelliana]